MFAQRNRAYCSCEFPTELISYMIYFKVNIMANGLSK